MAHFDGWDIKNETKFPDDKIAKLEDSIIVTGDVSRLEDGMLSIQEIGSVSAVEHDGEIEYEETDSDDIYFVIDEGAQTVIIREDR
ncbi:hypothetical protein [Macrococcus carouselicus]|uniref:Uncharacterized protein n=1 Tax=Macrococcus carouselicus TaxID=69969 RepID=A0A9Q8CKQ5_9STAP|nr:hypothetical protein [Macrococcus carouselicus]TDL96630.1 hypothetical protein ERX40_09765 [Macrococcus carouselicus]